MIILAIAACLSTVGGVYGAVSWKNSSKTSDNKVEQPKLQVAKTRMVSVPILTDGEVLGYIITRFSFTVDPELVKANSVPPESFVTDEAFKIIYENTPQDIKTSRRQAFKTLSSDIVAGVNRRLGREVVKDVLIDSWTYLSKQDMLKNNEHARK